MLLAAVNVFLLLFVGAAVLGRDTGAGLNKGFPWQFRLAATLRTPVLMFIVVPLSFLMWAFYALRDRLRLSFRAEGSHTKRVAKVSDQVKAWAAAGRKGQLRTARPVWLAMNVKLSDNKGDAHRVDVSHLDHILDVDLEKMTITAEPNVTMGQIQNRLLPHGVAMPVQIEMESLTLGGASLGMGMETTSHVHGFFQETVVSYELVTADGEVRTVRRDREPELFFALPWSFGSAGFVTAVSVRLVPIKEFVHVEYTVTHSPRELREKMHALAVAASPPDFLEATIYTKDTAVIQAGRWADRPSDPAAPVNAINWWWKPFYYKWVETFVAKDGGAEYIPFDHYVNRFTRSIFWELEDMIPFSNHPIYRTLWGWLGAPRVSLLKLFQGPVIRKSSFYAHVVQESIMPISKLDEGIEGFDGWFGVYPLLVFPLRVYDRGTNSGALTPRKDNLEPGKDWGIWVDLGAYGVPRDIKAGKLWSPKKNIRAMEHWTRDVGGWQAPYTDLCCTKTEFRGMFNYTLLDKARESLNAVDAFPGPYAKVAPTPGLIDLTDERAAEAADAAAQ